MEAFRLRIPPGKVEIVQASRVPVIGETVLDGSGGGPYEVQSVEWAGEYEPDGIRVLLAYVVAR